MAGRGSTLSARESLEHLDRGCCVECPDSLLDVLAETHPIRGNAASRVEYLYRRLRVNTRHNED